MVDIDKLRAGAGVNISLKDYAPGYTGEYKEKKGQIENDLISIEDRRLLP